MLISPLTPSLRLTCGAEGEPCRPRDRRFHADLSRVATHASASISFSAYGIVPRSSPGSAIRPPPPPADLVLDTALNPNPERRHPPSPSPWTYLVADGTPRVLGPQITPLSCNPVQDRGRQAVDDAGAALGERAQSLVQFIRAGSGSAPPAHQSRERVRTSSPSEQGAGPHLQPIRAGSGPAPPAHLFPVLFATVIAAPPRTHTPVPSPPTSLPPISPRSCAAACTRCCRQRPVPGRSRAPAGIGAPEGGGRRRPH